MPNVARNSLKSRIFLRSPASFNYEAPLFSCHKSGAFSIRKKNTVIIFFLA